jgi:hypothetical protein
MFKKILIANRGDHRGAAPGAAQPHCVVRAARTGDLTAETSHV